MRGRTGCRRRRGGACGGKGGSGRPRRCCRLRPPPCLVPSPQNLPRRDGRGGRRRGPRGLDLGLAGPLLGRGDALFFLVGEQPLRRGLRHQPLMLGLEGDLFALPRRRDRCSRRRRRRRRGRGRPSRKPLLFPLLPAWPCLLGRGSASESPDPSVAFLVFDVSVAAKKASSPFPSPSPKRAPGGPPAPRPRARPSSPERPPREGTGSVSSPSSSSSSSSPSRAEGERGALGRRGGRRRKGKKEGAGLCRPAPASRLLLLSPRPRSPGGL